MPVDRVLQFQRHLFTKGDIPLKVSCGALGCLLVAYILTHISLCIFAHWKCMSWIVSLYLKFVQFMGSKKGKKKKKQQKKISDWAGAQAYFSLHFLHLTSSTTLSQVRALTHCILVDSSTVTCWMSPFVILGVSGLFCCIYSIIW